MSRSTTRADWRAVAALVVLAMAGGTALWTHTGLAPDSVTYLDLAGNVVAGEGLVHRWAYWDPVYQTAQLPTPTSMWPPGLSLAIAAVHGTGMSLYVAARVIGVLSFAILALALYGLARFVLPPAGAFAATMTAVIPTLPWVPVIATELPYLAAATAASFCAAQAGLGRQDRAGRWWIGASSAAAAAFAFRYVGLANAAQVCLVAWFFSRNQKFGTLARNVALAGSVSALVIGAIFLRNYMVSGTPGQPWPGADIFWSTLPTSIKAAVSIGLGGRELWGPLVLLIVPAELLALACLTTFAGRRILTAAFSDESHDRSAVSASVVVTLMIVCTYALTIAATELNGMDLEDRYLLAPLSWVVLLLVTWCLRATPVVRRPMLARVAVAVWLACQTLLVMKVLGLPQDSYVQAEETSDVMDWLRGHIAPGDTVLSNRGAELAYWLPNPVMRLPRLPHASNGATSWSDVDRLADKASAHYLVHFRGYPEYAKYQKEEFLFLRELDNESAFPERHPLHFSHATVYRVGGVRHEK